MKNLLFFVCLLLLPASHAFGQCQAGFNWEQLSNSLTIHFINTSTSEHDITSYQWNFGDGHMGDGQNPNHTYDQPGTYNVCLIIHDNVGCVSDVCHEVVVEAISSECNAAFEWEQLPGTTTIHFINQSTSNHDITSYMWNFGDGHNGDGQNPNHHYEQPGTYTVCLVIHDNVGCVSDVCHEVVVEAVSNDCNAAFEWEQLPGTLTIHFINQSTSNHDITSYQWNFGDGHMGDGQNPNHTFDEPGVYNVCLIIHDNAGCASDVCHEVVVEAAGGCEADFNWEQLPGTTTIHFHSTSTSNFAITSYLWHFGDGHSAETMDPYHTYDQPGTYTVCLIIHDAAGCVSDVCHEITVEGGTGCEAGFTWEQLSNAMTIHFNNTSTSEHDITSYQWNFGDGHMGDGQNPNHTYEQPGTYTVCLIIHDAAGCVSDVCHEVVVEEVQAECNASFTWEQLPGTQTIHFNSTSTSNHDINSYQWNFGDGHMGDGHSPYHTYEQPGTYVVCLEIHDNAGCVSSVCHEVVVDMAAIECNAAFEWEQVSGTQTIHFINHATSNHEITSYQWDFGDGHMGDGHNPNHTYEQPGTYLVCLTIHDNAGCESTLCHEVVVEEAVAECQAGFNWEQVDSLAIHFINTSTSNHDITSYQWNFGDGHMGDGHNPTHVYDQPGVYTVCLVIHDNAGCVSDVCHEVAITSMANGAEFEFLLSPGGNMFYFNNMSSGVTGSTTWFWDFGDGATSSEMNPQHRFPAPGRYTVCLTMTDTLTGFTDHFCVRIFYHFEFSQHGNDFEHTHATGPFIGSGQFSQPATILQYNNPAKDEIRVTYELLNTSNVSIELFDINGQRLLKTEKGLESDGQHEITLSTGNLPGGVYAFHLVAGSQRMVRTILITH